MSKTSCLCSILDILDIYSAYLDIYCCQNRSFLSSLCQIQTYIFPYYNIFMSGVVKAIVGGMTLLWGMTPQTTPRYARGYIYSLWGSLGYPKTEQKPNIPKIFSVVKITTYIFTPVFSLFLALFYKKPLHIFYKFAILELALGEAR